MAAKSAVRAGQWRGARARFSWTPYLFLIAPVALFLAWVIGPMIYSFYLSMTNWDGVSTPDFIGLRNYVRLFDDPIFWTALLNNAKWLIAFITAPVIIGLALAMVLNRDIPGARAIKSAFYSPYIIAPVVIGLIWGWMYQPATGLFNSALRAVGVAKTPGWISDPALATWCIIAAAIWRQVGYVMTLYLAGLQGVDPSLIDASKVDGCNSWQAFRNVIFPLLSPITVVVVVISIIDSLRSFDLVFVMTRGGPANSSSVLANFMYIEAFNNYKMGYGAAIAVVLFLISAVFIFVYLRQTLRNELEY
jgi:multiple sugar transport system permease protein